MRAVMNRPGTASRPRKRTALAGFNLRSLEAFVAIVDAGSITRAAERLGLTQPAVSIALRELESGLGSTLLDRDVRPVRPTRAGVVLYRRATRLLADVEGLRTAVQTASVETLPTIRLGLVVSVTATGAPLIKALQDMADEVQVLSGLTPELGRALLAREVDLLITSDAMEDAPGLERHVVLHEPFVIAWPRHAEHKVRGASLAALAEAMPLVRYTTHSIIGKQIERHLRRSGIDVPHRLELDSSNSVLNMVGAGLGWAITTPLCVVQSGVDAASVAIHPLPGPALSRTLFLLNRRGEVRDAAERVRTLAANQLRELLVIAYQRSMPWVMKQIAFE
jgi:DNA-binding transcriptional LysR family regulator